MPTINRNFIIYPAVGTAHPANFLAENVFNEADGGYMSYNCVVIIREILDTRDLVGKILDDSGNLLVGNLSTRVAPEDMNALEMALSIKDNHGGNVTVLSLGEPKDVDVLRESLYRGVDNVIRLNAPDISELDTVSVANIYAKAISRLEGFDIILTGVDVAEGENSLLGAAVAGLLDIEHISYVDNLESIEEGMVACKRAVEMGYEIVQAATPALATVGVALQQDDPRSPRSAKAVLKLKKKKTPIETLSADNLGIDDLNALKSVFHAGFEPVEQKTVESKKIDPESETELKQMLKSIITGN